MPRRRDGIGSITMTKARHTYDWQCQDTKRCIGRDRMTRGARRRLIGNEEGRGGCWHLSLWIWDFECVGAVELGNPGKTFILRIWCRIRFVLFQRYGSHSRVASDLVVAMCKKRSLRCFHRTLISTSYEIDSNFMRLMPCSDGS